MISLADQTNASNQWKRKESRTGLYPNRWIGPFKVGDKYIYEGKEICKMLTDQYKVQFNNNTMESNDEEITNLLDDFDDSDLVDIDITEKDIIDAINDLDENSSAGPDEVLAMTVT